MVILGRFTASCAGPVGRLNWRSNWVIAVIMAYWWNRRCTAMALRWPGENVRWCRWRSSLPFMASAPVLLSESLNFAFFCSGPEISLCGCKQMYPGLNGCRVKNAVFQEDLILWMVQFGPLTTAVPSPTGLDSEACLRSAGIHRGGDDDYGIRCSSNRRRACRLRGG